MDEALTIFERHESRVRSYIRKFPEVFTRARGARVWGRSGRAYIDFFAGAGALNYGHNHPELKRALLDYLADDHILHALDMATTAKAAFIDAVQRILLAPRKLDYRLMFTGPTGANCVEAALKLARRATGRQEVVAFSGAFHGLSLGALAVTDSPFFRAAAGAQLPDTTILPYGSDDAEQGRDALQRLEAYLDARARAGMPPAACLVELIQGEGGARAAAPAWLRGLHAACRRHGVLLIVDDIQAGCGRSGHFFSFEAHGIVPDMVCLSKSLSGLGLPLSLLLLRPEHDVLDPGQHTGTFRGNNAAFITATAALERFWRDDRFALATQARGRLLRERLDGWHARWPDRLSPPSGAGMLLGLASPRATDIQAEAFSRGLIIETAGREDQVLKFLCPLNIADDELEAGLAILDASLTHVLG